MRSTLLPRLPAAIVLAIVVSAGLGSAFALADSDETGGDLAMITVPAPRLGDNGTYSLSINGSWLYGLNAPDVPFDFFSFNWHSGETIRDGEGRMRPSDELVLEGLQYSPYGP